jgi:hypothetical protein
VAGGAGGFTSIFIDGAGDGDGAVDCGGGGAAESGAGAGAENSRVYSPGPEDGGGAEAAGGCRVEKTPVAAEPFAGASGMPDDPGAPNIRVKVPGSRGAGSGAGTGAELKLSASGVAGIGALKNLVKSPGDALLDGGAGAGLALCPGCC